MHMKASTTLMLLYALCLHKLISMQRTFFSQRQCVSLYPVIFYYHNEIRAAQMQRQYGQQISIRAERLLFCLEYEYYVLFLIFWWKEAIKGSRQWVLDNSTLDYLAESCGHLSEVGGKSPAVIMEHMRSAVSMPSNCHNMCFKDG